MIHGEIQAEDIMVEGRRGLNVAGCDIGNDSFDFHRLLLLSWSMAILAGESNNVACEPSAATLLRLLIVVMY